MSTWLDHGGPDIESRSSVCFVRVFLDEINIFIAGLGIEHTALQKVGGPHSISWRPEYSKKAGLPLSKEEFCWKVTSRLKASISSFLTFQSARLPTDLGLASLHNHASQFLIENLSLSLSLCISLSVSLSPLVHTNTQTLNCWQSFCWRCNN